MADWFEDVMNLDLNLGPVAPASSVVEQGLEAPLEDYVDVERRDSPLHSSIREAIRQRPRPRWRWRHRNLPLEVNSLDLAIDSDGNGSVQGEDNSGTSHIGEGSVAAEDRSCEILKTCENNVASLESSSVEEKEDVEKTRPEEGSYFDCNICFNLARDPVVTCCGHLFCWSCIYRWLHIHSDANECPLCKGEVNLKNVTPIYGRGNHSHETEEDSGIKIPARPSAMRVESLRQTIQRTASSFPMEEMIRRIGARFDWARDVFQVPAAEGESESSPQSTFLNRLMSARALRREQTPAPEDIVDLTQDRDRPEVVPRRLPPLMYRRGRFHRNGSGMGPSTVDRFIEAFIRRSPPIRNRELQSSSMDDRDSFSSIAAAIHGESQTVDTAIEIDSLVSHSTSSSRRRHDTSRGSEMDSGGSRALRRRRLN